MKHLRLLTCLPLLLLSAGASRADDADYQPGPDAQVKEGEVFLINCHISPYEKSGHFNHDPRRERKLLLHKQEIVHLKKLTEQKGLTLVPLSAYLKNGKIKISIGVCQGKTKGDKRESLKKAEADRNIKRAMRSRQK